MNILGDHFLLCGGKFNLSILGLSFLLQRGIGNIPDVLHTANPLGTAW